MDNKTMRAKETLEKEIHRLTQKIPEFEALVAAKDDPAIQPFLTRIQARIEMIEDMIYSQDRVTGLSEIIKMNEMELKARLNQLAFLKNLTAWDQAEQAIPLFKTRLRELRKDLDAINTRKDI